MNKQEYQKIEQALEWAILNAAAGECPDAQMTSVQSLLQSMVKTRASKFDPHKTAQEYWCDGETLPKKLNAKPPKGSDVFHIAVSFADGDSINTTVYALDFDSAKDEAIRTARTRKMNRERGPSQYVRLSDGSMRKTSACEIADVVDAKRIQKTIN